MSSDSSDLVRVVQSGQKLQQAIKDLKECFSLDSIPEKDGYSELTCVNNAWVRLEKVREEFKKEYVNKKIGNVIRTVVPRPGNIHYLSVKISLFVFQSGWSNLADVMSNLAHNAKDNCCILIIVAVSCAEATTEATIEEGSTKQVVVESSIKGTVEERSTNRRTEVEFGVNSILVISGWSFLWLPPMCKAVCVVIGAGTGTG